MKVYLDDERRAPQGWWQVRWPDVVNWIEEAVVLRGFVPPEIFVHSANDSARQKMELGIASIRRLARR